MQSRAAILAFVSFQLFACKPLEVTVGKKSNPAASDTASSQDGQGLQLTSWNSMEDNLAYLDQLKQEGADALFKLYQDGGRHKIRMGFRHFRDAIVRDAKTADGDKSIFPKLEGGVCVALQKKDLLALDAYGDMRLVLGVAFLSRLERGDAPQFHARLPEQLDDLTQLAFFEFGIGIEGTSRYQEKDDWTLARSDVFWKVIHEQQDAESLKASDETGVRFGFARSKWDDGSQSFELSALAGPKVYENTATEALPAMSLKYESRPYSHGKVQALIFKKGLQDLTGKWQSVHVSRRIALVQKHSEGDILELSETNGYGLANETKQKFIIRLGTQEICSGLNGDSNPPAEEPKPGDEEEPTDEPQQNTTDNPSQSQ